MSKNKKAKEVRLTDVPGTLYTSGDDPLMLRSSMLTLGDDLGGVDTTTGLGGDIIRLYWKDKVLLIHGSKLLHAWVKTFATEDAKAFPKEAKS